MESSRRAGQEQTRFLVLQVQPPSSRNDCQRCRFFPTSTISSLRRGLRPNRHASTQQHRPCFLRWTGWKPTGMCVWPPIEETVAAHLCPASAKTMGSDISLPSKPCRMIAHLANMVYFLAGEGASALHAMAVVQVFQAKLLQSLEGGTTSPEVVNDLRAAMDFTLMMMPRRLAEPWGSWYSSRGIYGLP